MAARSAAEEEVIVLLLPLETLRSAFADEDEVLQPPTPTAVPEAGLIKLELAVLSEGLSIGAAPVVRPVHCAEALRELSSMLARLPRLASEARLPGLSLRASRTLQLLNGNAGEREPLPRVVA